MKKKAPSLFCLGREFMIRSFFRIVSFPSWVSQVPLLSMVRSLSGIPDKRRELLLVLAIRPRENLSRWRVTGVAIPEFRIFQAKA